MKLSETQVQFYHDNGYLLLENLFSSEEVNNMLFEMNRVVAEDSPRRILEKNGSIRSFFAPEQSNDLFRDVVRQERLVRPAEQLVNSRVYIHQTKLNSKHALLGDWWEWHQDYTFWKKDDGMPDPRVLTAMIFLNDVTEFNGPLLLIPGSHKAGVIDEEENTVLEGEDPAFSEYQKSVSYMSALTSELKYTVKQRAIAAWASKNGIHAPKGAAGSVLIFHGCIFHASSNNLSPWNRYTYLVTYNSTENVLPDQEAPRPDFLANRNYTPIVPIPDADLGKRSSHYSAVETH